MQPRKGRIGAIILAAGRSTRMGQPKLLLPLKGKPIFLHPVDVALAAGLAPLVLVVGEHEKEMRQYLAQREGVTLVKNEHFASGMGSSLKQGIQTMATQQVEAAVVLLADQPFVSVEVLTTLLKVYHQEREQGYLIFRPLYQQQAGHPILFDASLFPEFAQLEGDSGGRKIISHHVEQLKCIPFENTVWNFDIDTPTDYTAYVKLME